MEIPFQFADELTTFFKNICDESKSLDPSTKLKACQIYNKCLEIKIKRYEDQRTISEEYPNFKNMSIRNYETKNSQLPNRRCYANELGFRCNRILCDNEYLTCSEHINCNKLFWIQ